MSVRIDSSIHNITVDILSKCDLNSIFIVSINKTVNNVNNYHKKTQILIEK